MEQERTRRLKQFSDFPIAHYDQSEPIKVHASQVGLDMGTDADWRPPAKFLVDGVELEGLLSQFVLGFCVMALFGRPDGYTLEVYRDGTPMERNIYLEGKDAFPNAELKRG